jgi:hypothetical protein
MHWLSIAVIAVTFVACGGGKDEPRAQPKPAPVADAAPTPAKPTLTITQASAVVGSVQHTTDELVQDLTVEDPKEGTMKLRMTRNVTKHVQVLEVQAGMRSKVKVHYEVANEVNSINNKGQFEPLPVGERTYILTQAPGAPELTIEPADKAKLTPEARAYLIEDFGGELGRLPGMAAVIIGRTWTQGETVTLGADEIAKVAADMGGSDAVGSLTVTWTGSEGDVATFELVVELSRRDSVKLPMRATVELDVAHARPLEVNGTATIDGASAEGGKVTGTMTVHTVNRYE